MLNITKDSSTILKGIVIMMMLFLHLFNNHHTDLCTNLLYIGNLPFALWLSRACNPVQYFLLLSGYGLAYKYEKHSLNPKHQVRSILKLYLHYWIVLLVFLLIGQTLVPDRYPNNFNLLIQNILGWHTTYNAEMWFIFPYAIISFCSLYIIRVIDKIGVVWAFTAKACIHIGSSYLISRHGVFFFNNMVLYQPILFFHLLYAFTVGVIFRQTKFSFRVQLPQWAIHFSIIILISILCITDFDGFYMFCVPFLVILFSRIHYTKWLKKLLLELGRKSMPIWMIHTWLAYYLFQPQVYSLKYVPLIFIAVLVCSYLISIPVMWVAERINQHLPKVF